MIEVDTDIFLLMTDAILMWRRLAKIGSDEFHSAEFTLGLPTVGNIRLLRHNGRL